MAREKAIRWELKPHTEAKHVILRKYLNAWLPKLTRWNGRVVIIDAFAGPGLYSNGEEGSPIIALRAFLEHSYMAMMNADVKYLFVEADEDRCDSLREVVERIETPKNVHVSIRNEECEVALGRALDYIDEQESRLAPTFAFIDPFGVQVPLDMIRRLMAHPRCEVLITFMTGWLNRFLPTLEFEVHADRLYGCKDWRAALDMVGLDREQYLRTLYQRQLVEVVRADYVRFFTMKNSRNMTSYDLFFATNHPAGIDAMKAAMWKVDQSGSFSFSDATDPNQLTLFSEEPNWDQLVSLLVSQFTGTVQRWRDVEEAIRRSPFRILKKPLQAESKRANPRLTIIPPKGAKSGTLNENSQVRFEKIQ